MRALIVEDDPSIRTLLVRFIQRIGRELGFDNATAQTTNNVEGAIELLKESVFDGAFDLVLCDYNLIGHRKGSEVLEWIREYLSRLENRFVFLTSDEAIRDCGVPYFEKPCDMRLLRQAIIQLVRVTEN